MLEKFNIEANAHPQILLAPLDWGLGHATRCVPLIRYLIDNGCEVTVAAEGKQLSLLELEFPFIRLVRLRGYRLQYSDNRWKTIVKIIAQVPKIVLSARREHAWLRNFSQEKRFDAVISDNRYGFFLEDVPSIFITHQLNIKTPFGRLGDKILRSLNYLAINKFSACWVPDLRGSENLGGELSHPPDWPQVPVHFIGPLSRFKTNRVSNKELILVLLSGPEPQRSILETKLLTQLRGISKPVALVRGLPGEQHQIPPAGGNLRIYNHLAIDELSALISSAAVVVGRPGYSTVMEMMLARKNCVFIPTPGQSEQEYLADYLSSKNLCLTASQDAFVLADLLKKAETMIFNSFPFQAGPYPEVIAPFLESLRSRMPRAGAWGN